MIRRIVGGLAALVALALIGVCAWLWIAPPELLRVADGYAAKIVCSNAFLAGRDPQQVLDVDVTAAGNPVLKYIRQAVDQSGQTVTARMLGLFAPMTAVYRQGLGCTLAPDGNVEAVRKARLAAQPAMQPAGDAPWPEGTGAASADTRIDAILDDPAMTGPGMRAVLVVRDGRIVGERYGEGFDAETPLLSWSMAKTVTGILAGMAMGDGKLALTDAALLPEWADGRKDITVGQLAAMEAGLAFNEDYGDVTDVTRMLYLEPDMAGFAAAKPAVATPGTAFSYSTGVGMILSRVWMARVGGGEAALAFPRERLFGPLGMTSAVFETDEAGNFAGGSYIYASARDWGRLGQFLLQDGVWAGQRLLPDGLVRMMGTSNGFAGGYSQFLTWLEGPQEDDDKSFGLPKDTYWLEGHDGQSMAVIPSERMLVVRMGLTPSGLGYGPEPMIKALIAALRG
ncbi:MAG: serine hydrolase [Devosia sp.]